MNLKVGKGKGDQKNPKDLITWWLYSNLYMSILHSDFWYDISQPFDVLTGKENEFYSPHLKNFLNFAF